MLKDYIKRELAHRLDLFRLPDIRFEAALSAELPERVDQLLKRVRRGRPRDDDSRKKTRSVKRIVIFLFLAVLAGLAVSTEAAPADANSGVLRLEDSLDSMGTTYSVVVYGTDRYKMQAAVELAFEEVRRLDQLLSNYRADSELSQLNRNAAERPVKVSKELFDLLVRLRPVQPGERRRVRHHGRTADEGLGLLQGLRPVAAPRRDSRRDGERRIQEHRARCQRSRQCDFGVPVWKSIRAASAKDMRSIGWWTILRNNGIRSGLITAGSSSIYGIGAPPTEPRGWKIAIKHPKEPDQTVEEVFLKDMSMSTSGNYEKFFRAAGKVYSHIMDPRTGYPAQGMLSGFGGRPENTRQRSVDQAILHEWPQLGLTSQIIWFSRVSLRRQIGVSMRVAPMTSRFLDACRRRPTDVRPVWFMRQAGRYLKQYRDIRARHGILEICKRPDLAAAVTLQPVEILDVDAAIIFADLLLPVEPMGLKLQFVAGEGPADRQPVRTSSDIDSLSISNTDDLGYVGESIQQVVKALAGRVPVIGFVGAPFTLASYMIEGGPSKTSSKPSR